MVDLLDQLQIVGTYPWLIWSLDIIGLKFKLEALPKSQLEVDRVIMNLHWCFFRG